MKKYIYSFLILMMSCLVMVSCGDDDAAASKGAPAIGSAGTYTGTWTIINETQGTSYNIPGSVVLAQKGELAYVTNITTYCTGSTTEEIEVAGLIDGKSAISNIVNYTNGYAFSNTTKTGTLNTQCDGRIDSGSMRTKIRVIKTDLFTGEEEKIDVTFVGKKEE